MSCIKQASLKNLSSREKLRWLKFLVLACLLIEAISYLPTLSLSFGAYPVISEKIFSGGVNPAWTFYLAVACVVLWMGNLLLAFQRKYAVGVAWVALIVGSYFLPFTYGLHSYALFLLFAVFYAEMSEEHETVWRYVKILIALCYLNAAWAKLQSDLWLDGEMIRVILSGTEHAFVMSWFLIFLQGLFPLALFFRVARRGICGCLILVHLSMAPALGLYVFAWLMIGLNVLFLLDKEYFASNQ